MNTPSSRLPVVEESSGHPRTATAEALAWFWCRQWADQQLREGAAALDPAWLEGQGVDRSTLAGLARQGWIRRQGSAADGQSPVGWVLTEPGRHQVSRCLSALLSAAPALPRWRPAEGELCYAGRRVLRFGRAAPAQGPLLALLQEQGWPPWVRVPWVGDARSRRSLRDAVRSLNAGRQDRRIRFVVGRDGQSVGWQSDPEIPSESSSP